MSFNDIQDQKVAIRLLRGIVKSGRIPNGLLFWGPEGVGKGMTADEFTKAVNCSKSPDDACDTCLSCRKVAHKNHADVMRIAPTGKTRIIKTDVIEQVNEMVMFRPLEGGRRIVIIEDADRLNEPAQNKFLKTLEEPPSQTTFVLITSQPRFLLPTIRSRCQGVRFGTLRRETIAAILAKDDKNDPETCHTLAALAAGSMSRALQLLKPDRREAVMDVVWGLAAGEDPLQLSEQFAVHIQDTEKRITEAVMGDKSAPRRDDAEEEDNPEKEELEAHVVGLVRQEMIEHLVLFDGWYRDELIRGVTGKREFVLNQDHADRLPAVADVETLSLKLAAISEAWKYIERNMNKTRIFRDLFFVLAYGNLSAR